MWGSFFWRGLKINVGFFLRWVKPTGQNNTTSCSCCGDKVCHVSGNLGSFCSCSYLIPVRRFKQCFLPVCHKVFLLPFFCQYIHFHGWSALSFVRRIVSPQAWLHPSPPVALRWYRVSRWKCGRTYRETTTGRWGRRRGWGGGEEEEVPPPGINRAAAVNFYGNPTSFFLSAKGQQQKKEEDAFECGEEKCRSNENKSFKQILFFSSPNTLSDRYTRPLPIFFFAWWLVQWTSGICGKIDTVAKFC